jgi:calcium binding protein 39
LCGQLLCACARDAAVAELLLEDGVPLRLVCTARAPCCFEVTSTALATLQELLLGGAEASVAYLLEHFRSFFLVYNELLQCEDYATKRQALSVLGRVLLSPSPGFGKVMSRYASSARSLKVQMTLLLHPTATIKLGAFHIFKIFVANPHQTPAVQEILFKNREGLSRLLSSLRELCDEGDEDFREDLSAISADVLDLRRLKSRDSAGSAGVDAQRWPPKAADEALCRIPLRGRMLQARDLPQHCQPQGHGQKGMHEWSDLAAATTASESLALSEAVAFVGVH